MTPWRRICAALMVALTLPCAASPAAAAAPAGADRRPTADDHFGPLIGTWRMTGRKLQPDGETWVPNAHPALWRFYRILGGRAIQDDWISPAPDVEVPETERQYGTNIRIFDPATGRWAMAWIDTTARSALTFSATFAAGTIVMRSEHMDPPRRIVFHDVTADSFRWRQEWTFDGGETWTPVAFLEGTRVADD